MNLCEASSTVAVRVQREDMDKFRQVVLYVFCAVGGKSRVMDAVVHKLLYFIDFDYYEKHEESLAGVEYIKSHNGPTPVVFPTLMEAMIEEGTIGVKYSGSMQKMHYAIEEADLSVLSGREIKHIDNVLNQLSDKDTEELERYSLEDMPCRISKIGEVIPYEGVFYRDEVYSVRSYEDDI